MTKFSLLAPLVSLLLVVLVGCAHQKPLTLTTEEIAKLNTEALELASKRLEKMVLEAKKQGPESVQYLATNLFLKGNSALMEGDYVTGEVLFSHLVNLTDDSFVHKKYAVALIRLGEMEKSQTILESLYKRDSGEDESVALILAGVYAGLEQGKKAQKVYKEILARNPKQEDACIFLGKSYALEKKWKLAETHLLGCQKNHPTSGIFSYYLGKMSVERGDLKSAVKYFEESHQRDPSASQTTAALGIIYEQWEKPDKAISIYKRHLKLRPNDASILGRIVQALFIKEKFDEVIPYAERLVDLDPEDLNIKVRLGILYTDAKQFDKAISIFKELLEHAPQSDKILYYLGAIHQELQKYETAIEYFARIPTSSGLYQDSSFQMATMLSALAQIEFSQTGRRSGKGDEFVQFTQKKINEVQDLKVELSVLLASYHESIEEDESAVNVLKNVSSDKNFSLQHQYYLAGLFEKINDYDSSTNIVMDIIEKDPKNAHAWNFLGYSMLERGVAPDEALPYIKKALKLSPDDGYIRDSLGWYYFKIGKKKEALIELNHAFKKVPDDVVIAKHLAIIHKEMQNFAQAKRYLKHALDNARLMSEKREISSVLELLEKDRLPASTSKED
jgi:tetratricopeptide (TPR) repeat protein